MQHLNHNKSFVKGSAESGRGHTVLDHGPTRKAGIGAAPEGSLLGALPFPTHLAFIASRALIRYTALQRGAP